MTTMSSSYQVQAFGAPLAYRKQPTPEPEGSQVLLRVLAAGVCHTDLHTWQGWYDLGGGQRMSVKDRGVSLPLTLGHEIVGEVVAAGPDAELRSTGRPVLVYPWIGCGGCKLCLRGKEQLCPSPRYLGIFRDGGYADHVLLPHPRYLVDIGDLPAHQAAPFACSGLTAYSAIRKIDSQTLNEEPIVVIGAGGLGLMAVTLLGAMNGAGAVVVEPDASRRAAALVAGAVAVIDPAQPNAADQIRESCGGAVWAVIDCVGSSQTAQLGLDLLAKGGQLVQTGLFGGRVEVPTPVLTLRSISWQGSFVGSLPELRELLDLVRQRQPAMVPTCCRPLRLAHESLADLHEGRVVGRLILQPDMAEPDAPMNSATPGRDAAGNPDGLHLAP